VSSTLGPFSAHCIHFASLCNDLQQVFSPQWGSVKWTDLPLMRHFYFVRRTTTDTTIIDLFLNWNSTTKCPSSRQFFYRQKQTFYRNIGPVSFALVTRSLFCSYLFFSPQVRLWLTQPARTSHSRALSIMSHTREAKIQKKTLINFLIQRVAR
jgi:hypothetical protein